MWIRTQTGALVNTDALYLIYANKWQDDEDEDFVKYKVYGRLINSQDGCTWISIAAFDSECEADETVTAILSNITKGVRTLDLMRSLQVQD